MDRMALPTAQLDTSTLGRHLLAAQDAATARSLVGASAALDLPTDGTTDIGPYLQNAYDSGTEVVQLTSDRTYAWNSPVFLDKNSVLGGLVIEGNRARIKLGPDLPTTNWMRDSTTRFAIFPNTLRSALSAGTVTVSPATRATGISVGAIRPLTLRNATIDGLGANVGFSYANRCAVTFDGVTLWRARVGATWADYSDGNAFLSCYSRGGGPSNQALVEQVTPGDGLVVLGGKADYSITFARLRGCRGATIQGLVTARLELEECDGIVVTGSHFEGQNASTAMIAVTNSRAAFVGCAFYETYNASVGCITIDDSASDDTNTDLTLTDCTVLQLGTSDKPDARFSPLVLFRTVQPGTRFTARGLQGRQTASTNPGRWRDTAQPILAASANAMQSALDTASARGVQAMGDYQVRTARSGWEVVPADGGPVVSRSQGASPTITSVTPVSADSTGRAMGTLGSGTQYAYVAAVQDAMGGYTAASSSVSAVATATRALALEVSLSDAPGVLVLWRATAGSLLPDRYAILPTRAAEVALYDTGAQIGGRPWRTTSVPLPMVVAAINTTIDALILAGRAIYPA